MTIVCIKCGKRWSRYDHDIWRQTAKGPVCQYDRLCQERQDKAKREQGK